MTNKIIMSITTVAMLSLGLTGCSESGIDMTDKEEVAEVLCNAYKNRDVETVLEFLPKRVKELDKFPEIASKMAMQAERMTDEDAAKMDCSSSEMIERIQSRLVKEDDRWVFNK